MKKVNLVKLMIVMIVAAAAWLFAAPMPAEAAGDVVEGVFTPDELSQMLGVSDLSHIDLATVRYTYTNAAGLETYGLAEVNGDVETGFSYSFEAPDAAFTAVEGAAFTNKNAQAGATVIASCFRTDVWDGAVDVSWYDEESDEFTLSTPAELAGLAAIVNGNVDAACDGYEIKGERVAHVTDALAAQSGAYNDPDTQGTAPFYYREGDIDYKHFVTMIASTYNPDAIIPGDQDGVAHIGLVGHNFGDRTIRLAADIDLGGVPGSQINQSLNYNSRDVSSSLNHYDYPNWTPIGGIFLGDLDDPDTLSIAYFNGTFEGGGHRVENMYCYRWNYPPGSGVAYRFTEETGFFGGVGAYYRSIGDPIETPPAIRNMSISGYVFGRRGVGGLVGSFGRGTNSDWYNPIEKVYVENCANYAYAYTTDSKGVGGIVGSVWSGGAIVNCYNAGNITSQGIYSPAGGIVGENKGADILFCYNRGKASSEGHNVGRGIGANMDGSDYTVSDCYYLEGMFDCPDEQYQGYYYMSAPKSLRVSTTMLTAEQMTDGTLLNALNSNGAAFAEGDQGYPVLRWEKEEAQEGSLTIVQPEQGTIEEVYEADSYLYGRVIYLSNTPETGWNFRYYTLNGKKVSGSHITIDGDCVVSAVYEAAVAGVLNVEAHKDVAVTITKTGIVKDEQGQSTSVTDEPVLEGDPVYEGDVLTVAASIKDGAEPANVDMVYQGSRPKEECPQPYEYSWTYTDKETETSSQEPQVFTVDESINEADVVLTLQIEPRLTKKLWRYEADTSWYDDGQTTFTLTTPMQMAGIWSLVDEGETFAGKTIRMGADIDFTNDDGTGGRRWWNGVGNGSKAFSGVFDGQGHAVINLLTDERALFWNCKNATVKNVSVFGDGQGSGASGIISQATSTTITNCSSYRTLHVNATGSSGGILGDDKSGCKISQCFNYGDITYDAAGVGRIGGIVGYVEKKGGSITGVVNTGMVTSLTGNKYPYIGGIAGQIKGVTLKQAANYGNVTGAGGYTGGIAGGSAERPSLVDVYNTGSVTYDGGEHDDDYVGGLIGYANQFIVKNSHNYGTVAKMSGRMTDKIGAVFGFAGTKTANPTSSDVTSAVYYLNTSFPFAVAGKTLAQLDTVATYYKGINTANAATFAKTTGVLAAINGDSVYALTNGKYPEFKNLPFHRHSGGAATCTKRAVCAGCGLAYGSLDPDNHSGEHVETGYIAPQWMTDGTTGDVICSDCRGVIEKGTVVPADKTKKIMTVNFAVDGEIFKTTDYTVEQFDAFKDTTRVIWVYGKNFFSKYVTTQYVTLSRLLNEGLYSYDELVTAQIYGSGTAREYEKDFLTAESRYYYEKGRSESAPAALAIYCATGAGDLDELIDSQTATRGLLFGYGISAETYAQDDVSGNKFYSPIDEITFNVDHKVYGVTFDSAGGSTVQRQAVNAGAAAVKPSTPIRAGYTFLGWYLNDQEYDFNTTVTGDITLTAKWKKSALDTVKIYRLYNPKTNEHLWTASSNEYNVLPKYGWKQEGIAWYAPKPDKAGGATATSGGTTKIQGVYRLYNPKTKDHHYTASQNEAKVLTTSYGWTYDNNKKPLFYSGGSTPVYRLYNKKLKIGSHHLTKSKNEYNVLPKHGWQQEGVALKCVK